MAQQSKDFDFIEMEEFQSSNQIMHTLEVSGVTKDGAVFQVSQSGRYIYHRAGGIGPTAPVLQGCVFPRVYCMYPRTHIPNALSSTSHSEICFPGYFVSPPRRRPNLATTQLAS